VATTAVVPVGLTAHRERLPDLRTLAADEARALVGTIGRWQAGLRARLGTRFVWGGDELYLQAGLPIPSRAAYEGFPVVEDGIGLVRRFEDGWARVKRRAPARLARPRAVTVVTGEMYAPRLERLLAGFGVGNLDVRVRAIRNEWFGGSVQVAGLLTGADIQRQLAGTALGEAVLVPSVALRDSVGVFLDDLTPGEIASALGVPVRPVEPAARALFDALVGA
jgi:NifB/MoaA-like Fe-S oxidoreductase